MKTVALVPAKALAAAKGRLAEALSPVARAQLASRLLAHVVGAILDSDVVDLCAVVSPDAAVLGAARRLGAAPVPQHTVGLNRGLDEGRAWAIARRATALLVVLGDLPLLTPAEVAGLVAQAGPVPCAVLAPDRHGTGSNALLLIPPAALPFHFGPGSARRHAAAAHAAGLPLHFYRAPGTAFDLDTPADLQRWLRTGAPNNFARWPAPQLL